MERSSAKLLFRGQGSRARVLQSWWGWPHGCLLGPALQPDTCHPSWWGRTQRSCAQASSKRLVIAFLRMTLTSAGWQPPPALLLRLKTAQDREHDLHCYFSRLSLQKQDRNAWTPPPWIQRPSQTSDSVTLWRSDATFLFNHVNIIQPLLYPFAKYKSNRLSCPETQHHL